MWSSTSSSIGITPGQPALADHAHAAGALRAVDRLRRQRQRLAEADAGHQQGRHEATSLYPRYSGGRPPTFALPQRREIKRIALSRPQDHDLPFSTWSLAKLGDLGVGPRRGRRGRRGRGRVHRARCRRVVDSRHRPVAAIPLVAVVTIVLAVVAALALASAVAIVAVQLAQTSSALARVDDALGPVPRGFAPLDRTMTELSHALEAAARRRA
jgi:hypothetical protein